MSVVNDVLKNLNERHAKEMSVQSFPYSSTGQEGNHIGFMTLITLVVVVSIVSVILAVKLWQSDASSSIRLSLPADLFMSPEKSAEVQPDVSSPVMSQSDPVPLNAEKPLQKESVLEAKKELPIAKKTKQTVHIEQAVSALKKGNEKDTKSLIDQSPRHVKDELTLHMMVKHEPERVHQYIQKQFPDYLNHPTLLALATQGEQRSGRHQQAVNLYQQLIRLQPKQARWRAGMAISLESVGDRDNAKRMYQVALSMKGLPASLMNFSRRRLKQLVN